MMGLHPCSVGEDVQGRSSTLVDANGWIKSYILQPVGEIGTDLYWDKTYREQQEEAFRMQIQLGPKEYGLPIRNPFAGNAGVEYRVS